MDKTKLEFAIRAMIGCNDATASTHAKKMSTKDAEKVLDAYEKKKGRHVLLNVLAMMDKSRASTAKEEPAEESTEESAAEPVAEPTTTSTTNPSL